MIFRPICCALTLAFLSVITFPATAETTVEAEPEIVSEACRLVRFSDLGEPDLVIKNASVAVVLEALGYTPETQYRTPKQTFSALAAGEIDVFIGADWQTMAKQINQVLSEKAVDRLGINQVSELSDRLEAAWGQTAALPPQSEKGSNPEPGAAPPPVKETGIETLARNGFEATCPNAGRLFRNLTFPPAMTEFIAARMASKYEAVFDAAVAWFNLNRDVLKTWLAGVKTIEGGNAMEAVALEFSFE